MSEVLRHRSTFLEPVLAVLIFGVTGLLSPCLPQAQASGNNETVANEALAGHEYPWFDAETGELKPIDMPAESSSRSIGRNDVQVAQPPPASPATPATTPTGTGGGTMPNMNFDATPLLVGGVVILLVAILGWLLWMFLRLEADDDEFELTKKKRRRLSESIEHLPFEMSSTDGDFRSMAESAWRRGDFRHAIIYLYSHVLVSLDQEDLITLRKGKTSRQYLSEIRRRPLVSRYFQKVLLPFESVFFGDKEMEPTLFQSCWNDLDQFHRAIGQHREGAK